MSVLTSEAVVLRTWPLRESDLIVSFFTRDYGRMKGVAKAALKSRKRFGGALEPMTMARAWFAERPRQELVRLDQLEIVRSPLAGARGPRAPGGAQLLCRTASTRRCPNTIRRKLSSACWSLCWSRRDPTSAPIGSPRLAAWMPLTYFSLWMTRLMGLLPDVTRCTACGEALRAGEI